MGQFSVVLISHDGLDEIEKDTKFGEKLGNAINRKQHTEDNVSFSSGNHANPATIIGDYFHGDYIRFVVIEGGTGWVADGQKKPSWSSVTWDMVKRKFGGVKGGY